MSKNLAESSRVSENVLEYYMKYGKERELEKFMRYSSSSNSEATEHKSNKPPSCETLNKISSENITTKSQSMPTLSSSSSDNRERIIPIRLEHSDDVQNVPADLTTPPQRNSAENSKQTPESVAKVHKRLEWDSLADVGYEKSKSKSTSNVSIVERMLLREFFEVSSNEPKATNSSESDIRQLEKEIAELGTLKRQFSKMPSSPSKSTKDESKLNTPPLANSTHYEVSQTKKNSNLIKTKSVAAASTNTTSLLKEKLEKSAQTSSREQPEMKSQEVQVTLATTKEEEPTPFQISSSVSSFEYKAFTKSTSSSSNVTKSTKSDTLEETQKLHKMYERFELLVGSSEDKENNCSSASTSFSTSSTIAPIIDFGIQLLFKIMNAKTVERQQKKKFVKKIVKLMVKIANGRELHEIVKRTSALFESEISKDESKTKNLSQNSQQREEAAGEIGTRSRKTATEIVNVSDAEMSKGPSAVDRYKSSKSGKAIVAGAQKDHLPMRSKDKNESKKKSHTADSKEVQKSSERKRNEKSKHDDKSMGKTATTATTATTYPDCTTNTSMSATTTPISSSMSSVEPSTQKEPPSKAKDHATVKAQEWLKPITQSEIDFEKKKLAKRNLQAKNSNSVSSIEREEQLSWLESEIERLQGLRNILLVDEQKCATVSSSNSGGALQRPAGGRSASQPDENSEKLYDTVYSEQSKQSHCCKETAKHNFAPRGLPPKMPKNQNNRKQRSKLETPSEYDYQQSVANAIQRIMQELPFQFQQMNMLPPQPHSHHQHQQQHHHHHCDHCGFLPPPPPPPPPPPLPPFELENATTSTGAAAAATTTAAAAASYQAIVTDDCGIYTQSMHSTQPMVLPATYYNYPPTFTATATTTTAGGMETQTKTLNWQGYVEQRMEYPHSSPTQQTMRQTGGEVQNDFPNLPNTTTTQKFETMTTQQSRPAPPPPTAPSTDFRDSSELTVPMGSYGTSSTTTTTHHYDDVVAHNVAAAAAAAVNRAAVASQTGGSLKRSRPIYETRCSSPRPANSRACNVMPCVTVMAAGCSNRFQRSSMCIQTQPIQATAYALQFVVREQPQSSSSSTSTASGSSTSEELRILAAQAGPSLQEALQQRRPEFLEHAKNRKSVINRIHKMRQEREQEIRKIADENLSVSSLDRKLDNLPPPATERLRLFSTKEMKALSKKRIARLPEVIASKDRLHDERKKRSNRLLREVYNRRLQQRVRGGKLDFQHSRTLI